MDIIKLAKENNFFNDIIKYITSEHTNILEYDEIKKEWYYLRHDKSGRDFFDYIPITYITEDEESSLEEYIIEECGLEDYNWNDLDIDEVQELLYENNFITIIFNELQK